MVEIIFSKSYLKVTETLACYRIISEFLDQDLHTAHHSVLRSLPGKRICKFQFQMFSLQPVKHSRCCKTKLHEYRDCEKD